MLNILFSFVNLVNSILKQWVHKNWSVFIKSGFPTNIKHQEVHRKRMKIYNMFILSIKLSPPHSNSNWLFNWPNFTFTSFLSYLLSFYSRISKAKWILFLIMKIYDFINFLRNWNTKILLYNAEWFSLNQYAITFFLKTKK